MRMYFPDLGYRSMDRFLRDSKALQFKDVSQEQVNLGDHHVVIGCFVDAKPSI
jgi:hypothetical protein